MVEDEKHFLLDCELYTDVRYTLYGRALCLGENFNGLGTDEKLNFFDF